MPAFFSTGPAGKLERRASLSVIGSGRYQVGRRIGSGSFGNVYAGTDIETGEQVAVKSEASFTKQTNLLSEARIYKSLAGRRGFASIRHCGMEARHNVLVTDLLGASLDSLLSLNGRSFSLKTCLMLGDQLLERLEALHELGYVHRDLKPQNILMGRGEGAHMPHLIDFGLSKRFQNAENMRHIEYRENKAVVGTPSFASTGAMKGCEQGRRDDLESLGYVLVFLLRGSLPWQGVTTATTRARYQMMLQMKMSTPVEELCGGLEGQETLREYFAYCRGLAFQECPDYTYLRRLFKDLLLDRGHGYDFVYDWIRPSISSAVCPCTSVALETP